MISPKTTMSAVVTRPPTTPLVMSLSRIAIIAFTSVLPRSSVQRSRFPVFRSGWIVAASRRSCSSGLPSTMMRRSSSLKDMRPRFRPLKRPESMTKMAAMMRNTTFILASFGTCFKLVHLRKHGGATSTATATPTRSPRARPTTRSPVTRTQNCHSVQPGFNVQLLK